MDKQPYQPPALEEKAQLKAITEILPRVSGALPPA